MKKIIIENRKEIPKNVYTKICKNPACAIPFECDHGNREFCCERCKRNFERDLKRKAREKNYETENSLDKSISVFEERLQQGRHEITITEMKNRDLNLNIYTDRIKSLLGEIIYTFKNYKLHKTGEDKFVITKD